MKQWNEYSCLIETCGNTHCKYFTIKGCHHPYVKNCLNSSLYWPWQLDYDNMEILIQKRNNPLAGLRQTVGVINDCLGD